MHGSLLLSPLLHLGHPLLKSLNLPLEPVSFLPNLILVQSFLVLPLRLHQLELMFSHPLLFFSRITLHLQTINHHLVLLDHLLLAKLILALFMCL